MPLSSSFLRTLAMPITFALVAGCSSAQTSSSIAPTIQKATSGQLAVTPDTLPSQKCQHSPNLQVVPCYLTFTKDHSKTISVEGSGSGYAKLFDNCHRLARIYDFSGPAYLVRPLKAKGTCAAVFIHRGNFAILTIDDEL